MLRNPAYKGTAYFGKTKLTPRQRITRPIRLRGGIANRNSAGHERPQSEWIAIPVPAIITEETFAQAEELLKSNKGRAPRRTIAPSVVQGLVSCKKCGYALSRTSTRSSARMIHYYRCLGSDSWRHLSGSLCDSRPVRQDVLDEVVWREIIKLLETPKLIEEELERRLVAAKDAAPSKRREETLNREVVRIQKSIERLTTAYQEDLLSLDELRQRLPALRQREAANRSELQSITDQIATRAAYLRLAQTLTVFLDRLRQSADTLNVEDRQRIVRLLVKEVLVADDTIVIRHSIPVAAGPQTDDRSVAPAADAQPAGSESYLLRKGRHFAAARQRLSSLQL
jgi:site-specific DNA recombinase